MSELRLVSRERVTRLTDAETVRLGRLLHKAFGRIHVSFPEDTPTPVAVAHHVEEELPTDLVERVAAVLGEFDQIVLRRT